MPKKSKSTTQPAMRMPMGLTAAESFFWTWGGFSHGMGEHPAAGRLRCAQVMARAETWAREEGYAFNWSADQDTDSSDFSDSRPVWTLYQCAMVRLVDGNGDGYGTGECVQSLHGIDFGRDNEPYGTYRRVVEAELAAQQEAAS